MQPPKRTRTKTARSRADEAREQVKHGGVQREDSDDELGTEDNPWEWIYTTAKSSRSKSPSSRRQIIGARTGNFECRIGDCVLLKAEGYHQAWIGMICEFIDNAAADNDDTESTTTPSVDSMYPDEDDDNSVDETNHIPVVQSGMAANFMWFSSAREVSKTRKKVPRSEEHELFLTPSWDVNPLASINGKATILSRAAFIQNHKSGQIHRRSKAYGKTFFCRRGCNTRTATFTDEFDWHDVFQGPDSISDLIERIKKETRAVRNKADQVDTERDSKAKNDGEAKVERAVLKRKAEQEEPQTPRKYKKRAITKTTVPSVNGEAEDTLRDTETIHLPSTPATVRRTILKTPGSRSETRIVYKKALMITPLASRTLSPSYINSTPHQRARTNLHVSAVPTYLPCRQAEFETVYTHLEAAIIAGTGSCIYISGTPGTGKTATVREVIAQLEAAVQAEELDDFHFVEINGMKVTEPTQAYSLLWQALRDERVSPSQALGLLEREFSQPSPRRVPCVVLMDELDQLVSKSQSVMYNFFNWPTLAHSRLIVLAVANTMDLPERMLSNKISSRLGLTRILFPGYTHEQLMEIIRTRLADAGDIVDSDAIQFAARKVAAVSGDARRCLEMCRRAVEIAEADTPALAPDTPSKRVSNNRNNVIDTARTGHVTISTIKQAIHEATSSPLHICLKSLSAGAKVFLAGLLACSRRSGLHEHRLLDIIHEVTALVQMSTDRPRALVHILQARPRVQGLVHVVAELADLGVITIEGGKGPGGRSDRIARLRSDVGMDEIGLALRDDGEVRGMGFG